MKMFKDMNEKIDPGHTALLVIDYQNEFCDPGGVFAQAGFDTQPFRAIEQPLVNLIDCARDAGVHLVWIRNTYNTAKNLYLSPAFMEQAIRCWEGRYSKIPVCREGSWGQEFYGRVSPEEDEAIVTKHRYNAFIGTDLEITLRAKSIKTVVVCGITTNLCVETTVRHAFCLDYHVVVPRDAVAHWHQEAHEAALLNMQYGFAELSRVGEIRAVWAPDRQSDD